MAHDWTNLETIEHYAELSDCYGSLLSPRQQRILVDYLGENLSLAEIAGELSISRQAVHSQMLEATRKLDTLEAALQLNAARRTLSDWLNRREGEISRPLAPELARLAELLRVETEPRQEQKG